MYNRMFERKEQAIREHRTFEAMKRGLMGYEGKLCRIARTFGSPLYKQGASNFEATYLEDPWLLDDDEIPVMDEEEVSVQVGWHFDGLRRGMHMEILWLEDFRELKAYYKGRLVYREVGGELDGFTPHEEWEITVEDLYEQTKKKERQNRKEQSRVINAEAQRQQQVFLDAMKQKWGI